MPRPSMVMFCESSAKNRERLSKTAGFVEAYKMAPPSIRNRTWLRRWIVPDVYSPGGSNTVPPPAFAQASTAF